MLMRTKNGWRYRLGDSGTPIGNGYLRIKLSRNQFAITWPWKVKVMTLICLMHCISKMAG